jgi:Bacterial PH domain
LGLLEGLFDGLLGHGSEVDAEKVIGKLEGVLLPDETVQLAYRLIRDFFVFTENRLIIVEIQGMTGKKVDYLPFPIDL